MRSLTRDEVRDVDRRALEEFGIPGVVLMENAGRNAASYLHGLAPSGPLAIVCGKGNNAGDGFVMARHLQNLGRDVGLYLACDPAEYRGDAAINYGIVSKSRIPCRPLLTAGPGEWRAALTSAVWIVDALLGTGLSGMVREPFSSIIGAINSLGHPVFSVDTPSGLDCNTGRPLGSCIKATVTGTFVARKVGFDAPTAAAWLGRVEVLDIGVPQLLLAAYQ